jgi:3-hydroxybutyryl-CoA dehydrogenase
VILGVVGAGTMGAGIAQLGCAAGYRTLLHDPLPEALEAGERRVRDGLERWAAKGRADAGAAERLARAPALADLAECDLVIEAAPERPELKRELFAELSRVCGDETVLATNTSSIPVTSLARAAARPENVVGMHFFNPPPLMELLEVIRADQTGDRAVALARSAGEAMGKRVILASDGPGFLVNRCGRPFSGEGLRLLTERIATHDQIDRICRMAGGFRMGPFELMDLVGIDVGFEVAKSFAELSFGEPRWRPSPIQARMVAAGRLGRKTGHGYYDHSVERAADPEPAKPGGGDGTLVTILGAGPVADGLRERARAAGYELREGGPAELVVDAGPRRAAAGAVRGRQPGHPRRARRGRLRAAGAARLARRADPRTGHAGVRGGGGRGLLRPPRPPPRVGRGRAGAGARPDRLPARQRGLVRGRRGSRLEGRRRHRDGARPRPPARADRVGRGDRHRPRDGRARRPLGRAP